MAGFPSANIAPVPEPPPPSPVPPRTPVPDFYAIGADILRSIRDSNVGSAVSKFVDEWIAPIVGAIIGALLALFSTVAVYLANFIIRGESKAEPAFQELAKVAVEDLFGVSVNIGQVQGRGQRAGRQAAAASIGEAVLKGLFAGVKTSGSATLEPGMAAANNYLTTVTQLALEGWLEGWMVEALSVGQLEKFADLDDIMAQVLGLGRLSRRVLNPVTTILVETPAEWLLNKTYRPKLLSPGQVARQVERGAMKAAEAREELARQGWSDRRIEMLLATEQKHVGLADLDFLVSHDIWSRESALLELIEEGWSRAQADTLLTIERQQKLDTYKVQMAQEAMAQYAAREIGDDQFRRIMETLRLPPDEVLAMRQVAGLRRELRVKEMTTGQWADAVKAGLATLTDFRRHLVDEGYRERDALNLELLLTVDIRDRAETLEEQKMRQKERAAAAERRVQELKEREQEEERRALTRGVSLAAFQDLVRAGIRSIEDYRTFLLNLEVSTENAGALTELFSRVLGDEEAARRRREELGGEARARQVDLGSIEQAVKDGILSPEEYQARLVQLGFESDDRRLLGELLAAEMERDRRALERRAEAERLAAEKQLGLGALETALRLGLIRSPEFLSRLRTAGFSADDSTLLLRSVEAEIALDAAARLKREEAVKAAAVRRISLGDIERAVVQGVRDISYYRQQLTTLGFTLEDQDTLVRLLELDITARRAAIEARAEAEARLRERNISLGDLEGAVVQGVVSVEVYRRALEREGFTPESVSILVASLLAKLGVQAAARRRAEEAEAAGKLRGVNIGQLQDAVELGLMGIPEYLNRLIAMGFPPQDAQFLAAVLQAELAERAAAEERRRLAAERLRAKGLSLSQFEQAVREGLRTLDDYARFLALEGFNPEDVSILVHLLLFKLEDEAEKAAAAAAPK